MSLERTFDSPRRGPIQQLVGPTRYSLKSLVIELGGNYFSRSSWVAMVEQVVPLQELSGYGLGAVTIIMLTVLKKIIMTWKGSIIQTV